MIFTTWVAVVVTSLTIGEALNCRYARYDRDYDSEGMVCQWEHETFYYDEESDKWILKEENIDDNCIEKIVRKKYWKKRNGL